MKKIALLVGLNIYFLLTSRRTSGDCLSDRRQLIRLAIILGDKTSYCVLSTPI